MARILIGNVKGPIGATGPVGPRGPEGPQGIQGPLCPLTNNALATVPGVAALDAVMGKTLSDKDAALQTAVTQLNSDSQILSNNFTSGYQGVFKAASIETVPVNGWNGSVSSAMSGSSGWTALTLNIGDAIRYRLQIENTGQLTMYRTLDNFATVESKVISAGW